MRQTEIVKQPKSESAGEIETVRESETVYRLTFAYMCFLTCIGVVVCSGNAVDE